MILWVLSNYTICKMLTMIWHYCSIRFCLAAFKSPLTIFWVFTRCVFDRTSPNFQTKTKGQKQNIGTFLNVLWFLQFHLWFFSLDHHLTILLAACLANVLIPESVLGINHSMNPWTLFDLRNFQNLHIESIYNFNS